ncbi:ribonuclease H-like domain-containing protein [Biscogniauxia mediterranea]|nr:ribonuclease H-like domain-containing protein [Biscogniauxia mediterranea]
MPFIMDFTVDGGCRPRVGSRRRTVGGAAAVLHTRNVGHRLRTRTLLPTPRAQPTNQRAELTAMILALEWALARYRQLGSRPRLVVRIRTDSRYAVGCLSGVWAFRWDRNGWRNARGVEVANRDLIERALNLADVIEDMDGTVTYEWIPRHENEFADRVCRQVLQDACEQLLREEEEEEEEEDWLYWSD